MDPRVEMFQRGQTTDSFFNMKALAPRPISNATEFDTDFEDDMSEPEDNSPRLSVNSISRRSETTLSSFEEVHTPSPDSHEFQGFNFDLATVKKAVEGPRGPHLFRSSVDSSIDEDDEYVLAMSPMTPRPSTLQRAALDAPSVPEIPIRHRHLSTLTDAVESLDLREVSLWTPRQVARWMHDAGFEPSIVEKFKENDISGAILITLKFEDLRELDIPSFGQRTKVWNEIHVLRGSAPGSPKPPTPIEEAMTPCTEVRQPQFLRPSRQLRRRDQSQDCNNPSREPSRRRQRKQDVITPLESVSIVGIEQLMPKPHKCAKGENCSKWKKQQRLIDNFKKDHPVSPEGGTIWVAGDPGNPLNAPAIDVNRPISEAVPSVVASSDVLGPGPIPAFLEEASLRNVQLRDPQENVKQFLKFQHMDPGQVQWSSEEPPSPPYEMFPTLPTPHTGLRGLPRLAIPSLAPPRPVPPPRAASANAFAPYRMERAEAMSPDLRNATQSPATVPYRFGTPFSEMDIPVTAIQLGPVSRDASQSVPPNMNYRHAPAPPQRTQSRSSARRPSFAMPRVDENISTAPPTHTQSHGHQVQPPRHAQQQSGSHHQWSPVNQPSQRTAEDIAHAGWMKKRKTRMLRHEWHEHHFTLKGTRLAMHKDAHSLETLEYIDVDDYAIACSSLASGSKLNAAFKAMNISRGKTDKKDDAVFSFQLIPAAIDKGMRLKKRESAMAANGQSEGKDAKAKTHYFAVKSRDEGIDWMRELMLAKALKQKSEGYEVNINGNMI
jgi:Ni/Co efflux regulator RcnB